MDEYLKPLYPEGPCNRTDPIVRHDSQYRGGVIVKLYEPQNDLETNKNNPNANFDSLAVDAIHVPVVKLNIGSTTSFPSNSLVKCWLNNSTSTHSSENQKLTFNYEFVNDKSYSNTYDIYLNLDLLINKYYGLL